MNITSGSYEQMIWRWIALFALILAAFLIANSQRYIAVGECSGSPAACVILDRWSGRVEIRIIEASEEVKSKFRK